MQSIFLDIDGKSARVQLQALLEAQPRPEVVLKTESGRVETQRVLTGVKSVAEVAFQDLCECREEGVSPIFHVFVVFSSICRTGGFGGG